MHAVISNVRIEDPGMARAALADLRLKLVPRAPGFVSAYWLEPIDGIGMSVIVFETKEHAEEAAAYPGPSTARRNASDRRDPRGLRQRLSRLRPSRT